MPNGINKVTLVGYIGREVQIKQISKNLVVGVTSLATTTKYTRDNELVSHTDWHTLEMWDKLADKAFTHLEAGQLVYVEGRLKYDEWEREGQKQKRAKIVVHIFQILAPAKSQSMSDSQPSSSLKDIVISDSKNDDLPF